MAPLIEAGLVATCGVVELEILDSARGPADHSRRQGQLQAGFESLAMPDEVWSRALAVQTGLARIGAHRSVALPDLLIAATAERHSVTLVHYDHDYDIVRGITGQSMTWVLPRGAADS